MWRTALTESGRWVLALLGALLIAAGVSAMAGPDLQNYAASFAEKLPGLLTLDFGHSAISGAPAAQELAARGPATANILGLGALIAVLLGAPLGLALGTGAMRRATAPLIQIVSAAPIFCAGLALAYLAHHLFGFEQPDAAAAAHLDAAGLRALALPAVTVGLAGTAAVQMALRRAESEAQDSPFRSGLRRLGLSMLEIERVHIVPQVFAGLLRSLGEVVLALLSATVVAEWVFNCRGIADLFVKSVALHDWAMAAPILFVFAGIAITAEFLGRLAARLVARGAA